MISFFKFMYIVDCLMFVVIKFIVIGFNYIYCDSGCINLNFLFNCFRDI